MNPAQAQRASAPPTLTRRTMELIQKTLDAYDTGIVVTTVNLTDVQVPEPVMRIAS